MPSPHVLPDTEIVTLASSANGRRYQLHVSVPPAHTRPAGRRLPVVYMTDPYWDFPLVYATTGNLVFDKAIPSCVVVGIGYPGEGVDYEFMRTADLTPAPDARNAPPEAGAGGGPAFLRVLEEEIIPLVERSYPASADERVLLGSSLGGLFALYAMFARPGLFQAFVSASPAAMWANEWLLGLEDRFAAAGGELRARLFLSGAAEEWPDFLAPIVRFEERLRKRAYPGLVHQWRLVEGERHSGTKAEAFTRGLRFAFGG